MKYRTIETYTDSADLVLEYAADQLSDEELDVLHGECDYQDFLFTVINGETVISSNGGIVFAENSLEDFIRDAIEYAREEALA